MPIQFNDDLEVNEITKHSRAVLDELFWEDDEIAEFRHHAFLVSCGLEKDDEDDEEDEMVSLEGFELSEEEKSVVTQMHSSLPVIDIDFEILESKQKCLKKANAAVLEQVQEKPKQPKIKNRISNLATTPRIPKVQVQIPQRNDGTLASTTNSPFRAVGKKTVLQSPFRKALLDDTIEERVEKEDEKEIDDSRRNISIKDRLRLWKERDEVSRISLDSPDRPPIDIPSPPQSRFLETSSPRIGRPRVGEKKLRGSTRTPRLPPLDLDNSGHSPSDLSPSRSQTSLDASSQPKLDDSQRSGLNVSQRHLMDTPLQTQQNSSQTIESDLLDLSPKETQAERASRKSPKPKRGGAANTKSSDTPRSSKKKLTHEVASNAIETTRQSNSTASDDITASQLSAISVDLLSTPHETPRSRKKKTAKVTTKEKSLSLSSTDTTSTQSTDIPPKSPRKKSPKPCVSSDVLVTPRAARKSSTSKPSSLSSLECDGLHSLQDDPTQKHKKRSSKSAKMGEKQQSLSSLEAESSHSINDPPKSPKRPSATSKKTLELASPRSSKGSSSTKQSDESDIDGDGRSSKKSLKGSKIKHNNLGCSTRYHQTVTSCLHNAEYDEQRVVTELLRQSVLMERKSMLKFADTTRQQHPHCLPVNHMSSSLSDELVVDKKSPSAVKKKSASISHESEQDGKESPKSRSLHRGTTVPTKRHSVPVPIGPTTTERDTSEQNGEDSPKPRSLHRGTSEPRKRNSLPVPVGPAHTVTVTIRRGKKKEEASNMRRKVVRRSLSSCLVHMSPEVIEWRATVKRSNSVKMPKAIS